ncbi:MAG: IS256 family transposase [Chitinophagales bacterium]
MELTKEQTENVLSNFLNKKNGLNEVLQMMLNAMMKIERKVFLEGGQNNKGNGYRLGKVFGYGSQIELRIPRDRLSSYTPTILALFREQQSYIKEVSFQLYGKGLTDRDISDVVETIYGKHYSKSTISDFSRSFYEQMGAWRERKLDRHYLALYIDGLHVKLKRGGHYGNECFYIIMGLKEDCTREVISIVNFPEESAHSWERVFEDLRQRGVESVGLVVSDGLSGLDGTISRTFSGTPHQKCIVHLQRNIRDYVRKEDRQALSSDLREVLSPDDKDHDKEKAYGKLMKLAGKWGREYKQLERYIKQLEWQPYFTYLDYSVKVRRMIYTTNWIERFNKSARRTLKVRGAFPDEESVLALITSVAMEKQEKKYKYPVHNFKFEPKLFRKQ